MQITSIIALRIVPPFGLMDVWHITHFGWILYQSCIHFVCALNTQSQFSWLCIRRFSSSRQIIQWSDIFTIEETGRVDSILSKKLDCKLFRSHDWDTIQYRKLGFVRYIVFRFDNQYKRRLFISSCSSAPYLFSESIISLSRIFVITIFLFHLEQRVF